MHPRIVNILESIDSGRTALRPTELYNEGWMLRLLLDWVQSERPTDHRFALSADASWESLIEVTPTSYAGFYRRCVDANDPDRARQTMSPDRA